MIERCPWYVAGPLLGLLIVGLRAAINKPFGALGGFIDLAENIASPRRWGVRAYLLVGLAIGGVAFSALSRTLGRPTHAVDITSWGGASASALTLLAAGLVMGFGAVRLRPENPWRGRPSTPSPVISWAARCSALVGP